MLFFQQTLEFAVHVGFTCSLRNFRFRVGIKGKFTGGGGGLGDGGAGSRTNIAELRGCFVHEIALFVSLIKKKHFIPAVCVLPFNCCFNSYTFYRKLHFTLNSCFN